MVSRGICAYKMVSDSVQFFSVSVHGYPVALKMFEGVSKMLKIA